MVPYLSPRSRIEDYIGHRCELAQSCAIRLFKFNTDSRMRLAFTKIAHAVKNDFGNSALATF